MDPPQQDNLASEFAAAMSNLTLNSAMELTKLAEKLELKFKQLEEKEAHLKKMEKKLNKKMRTNKETEER